MFKLTIFTLLLTLSSPLLAARPTCLPAVLALSAEPMGTPVVNNNYWPTISSLPLGDGVAAFWYCQANGHIRVAEMHGTPEAIAQYGGLNALHLHYKRHRDDALDELRARGHACADPHVKPTEVKRRTDCIALPPQIDKAQSYLCLNPQVSSPQELKLCKHLLNEMAAQWPR